MSVIVIRRRYIKHEVRHHVDLRTQVSSEAGRRRNEDFKTVSEVSDSRSVSIGVAYYDYFVASVDESLGELVDVGFDSTGLWIEKVTYQATSQQARQKEREGEIRNVEGHWTRGFHYSLGGICDRQSFGRIFSVGEGLDSERTVDRSNSQVRHMNLKLKQINSITSKTLGEANHPQRLL
jgi:hypothetical protein